MRVRILLLLLAVTAPAFAFRGRPVSDVRFEDSGPTIATNSDPYAVAAASDGTGYLVLLQAYSQNVYAQIISQGGPYGPPIPVGSGTGGSVIWTGSEYLVVWDDANGVYLTAVSRWGILLSGPRLVISAKTNFAAPKAVSNGRRILVTLQTETQLIGALVDLNGQPAGNPFTMIRNVSASRKYELAGTRDGFALGVFSGVFGDSTSVFRFSDAAGSLLTDATRLEGPSYQGALASDGTDVAILFETVASPSSGYGVLKTAIIGSRGEIAQPPRLVWNGPAEGSLLWNGSEYLAFRTEHSNTSTHVSIQRISRTGELLDTEMSFIAARSSFRPAVVASNGREYLIAIGRSFVRLPIGSSKPTALADLARSTDPQERLSMARGRRDFLAVWRETDRNGDTIRASRVDAKGRYLDGTGIVIAPIAVDYSSPAASVDSDGENWLIVWSEDAVVYGCRVSPEGVVLDPRPIRICEGWSPVVRWGSNSWLVVNASYQRNWMTSTTVTPDGLVGPLKQFDQIPVELFPHYSTLRFENPVLAFDGREFVVAFYLRQGVYAPQTEYVDYSLVTERLSASGDALMGSRISLPRDGEPTLSLASNGPQTLLVFGTEALLLDRGYAPTTIVIDQGSPSPPQYWLGVATAWNGSEFVIAALSSGGAIGAMRIIHTSPLGYTTSTATLPRDPGEVTSDVIFPVASPSAQPADLLLGRITRRDDTYEGESRVELLFESDATVARPMPSVPIVRQAISDASGLTLSWQPQDHVLGFEIELRQLDGTERLVGIAPGSATSTHILYGGMTGTAVRLRAWNAAGRSEPSMDMEIAIPRVRGVGK